MSTIIYKPCSEVPFDSVYDAFRIGFSDYIIPLEMPKDLFNKHFFGPEGNGLEYSYIAMDGDKAVGLLLGGIKEYEGLKTLRCGAMCVHPEYRGKEMGISLELFRLHKQLGINQGCRQLFLEVITGNDRAIQFYKKQGYIKVYDLSYFSWQDDGEPLNDLQKGIEVKRTDFETFKSLSALVGAVHINWQNEFDYINKLDGLVYYGVYNGEKLAGGLCLNPKGRVHFIWIDSHFRNKGIARHIIKKAMREHNIVKVGISFPNNARLEGFVRHCGFVQDQISQYEMYYFL